MRKKEHSQNQCISCLHRTPKTLNIVYLTFADKLFTLESEELMFTNRVHERSAFDVIRHQKIIKYGEKNCTWPL